MDAVTIAMFALGILVVAGLFFLVPFLTKKAKENNVPVEQILDSTGQLVTIVQNLLQTMNVTPETKGNLDLIIKSSQLAVRYAEQLYVSGQLPKEERKNAAIQFVQNALIDSGIEITPEKVAFITAVVESAVFLLPKTTDTVEMKGTQPQD